MFELITGKSVRPVYCAFKSGVFAATLLLLSFPVGCKKSFPGVYQFRYRFQPGKTLKYDVSIDGNGEVTLFSSAQAKKAEEITLPVDFKGSFLLEAVIDTVSPDGTAGLGISYKDFSCRVTNRVRDREITMSLTDSMMRVEERGEIKKELRAGDSGFPLNGIAGSTFEMEVDSRGKIIRAQVPPDPGNSFPYMKLDNIFDQIQPEFPLTPIAIGTSWSREVKVSPPELGRPWNRGQTWAIKLNSTFRGFKKGSNQIALIDLSGNIKQSISPEEKEDQSSGLKRSSHKLTGTIEFDLTRGIVLSSRSILEQELDIMMLIEQIPSGNKIKVHIKDSTAITVKLKQ